MKETNNVWTVELGTKEKVTEILAIRSNEVWV